MVHPSHTTTKHQEMADDEKGERHVILVEILICLKHLHYSAVTFFCSSVEFINGTQLYYASYSQDMVDRD